MKKILLSLFTFVVALTSAFADEAKFDFTAPQTLTPAVTPSTEASTGVNVVGMTFTNKNVSVAFSGEDEKAKIFTGSEAKGFPIELRIYKNATMTITAPQGKNITSIEFNGYTIKFNADKGSLEKKAWTGSTNSVVFTPTETSKVNTIVVTYGEGGGDVVDPTPNPVDPTPSQGTGNGSLENPFDAVAANNLAASLEKGKMTDTDYYIKGKVSEVREAYNTAFGNGSFCISVDGTTEGQFLVWRALYLKNEKYADGKVNVKVGDDVIVCGKIMNYVDKNGNSTYETAQGKAYLYSLNGKTDSEVIVPAPEAKGKGTLEEPYNAVAAIEAASKLDKDTKTEGDVYIKGIVSSVTHVYSTEFGTAQFSISEDGKTPYSFLCYGVLYLDNKQYDDDTKTNIKVGDEVIVCGKLMNFKGTLETANKECYLYSLNGTTTGIQNATVAGNAKQTIYTLDGRKVNNAVKGVYIINGKKVVK